MTLTTLSIIYFLVKPRATWCWPRFAVAAVLSTALPLFAGAATDFSALVHRGFQHLSGGRYAEAAADLEEALAAEPASAPVRQGLGKALAGLATGHFQAGRLAESRAALERAVALRPDDPELRRLLAEVL